LRGMRLSSACEGAFFAGVLAIAGIWEESD
jgi:hypothetical protein